MSELVFINPSDPPPPNPRRSNPFDYFEARVRLAGRDFANLVRRHFGESVGAAVLLAVGGAITRLLTGEGSWKDKLLEIVGTGVLAPIAVALLFFVYYWIRGEWRLHGEAIAGQPAIQWEPYHRRFFALLCLLFVTGAFVAAGLWAHSETRSRGTSEYKLSVVQRTLSRTEAKRKHLQGESDYRRIVIQGIDSQGGLKKRLADDEAAINGTNGYKMQIASLQQQLRDAQNKPPKTITVVKSSPIQAVPESLKRLIAYEDARLLIEPWDTGKIGLLGFDFRANNVGADTLAARTQYVKIYLAGSLVWTCAAPPVASIIPQTQGTPVKCRIKDGGHLPMSTTMTTATVEFEVDYDTIPATGTRRSFRKLEYDLSWPNGANNGPSISDPRTADEWEK